MGVILQGAGQLVKLLYTFNFQRSQQVLETLANLQIKLQLLVCYLILNRVQ